MLLSYLLIVLLGFVSGVLVNLLADYLPARRYHHEASRNPFVSKDAIPPIPPLLPPAPIYAWSGWLGRLTGRSAFSSPRWTRRLIVELLLPVLFVWLLYQYGLSTQPGESIKFPYFLFYGAGLTLIAVVDIERRWILDGVLAVMGLVAILQCALNYPGYWYEYWQGASYGFAIMFGLYLLGMVFGQGMGVLRGRGVGRTVMGLGDVKLVVIGGLILGWPRIGFALLIMTFAGAFGALVTLFNQIRRKGRLRLFSAIPYAPYIALGIAIMDYLPWLAGYFMAILRR